jgi:hypothetical protein
MIKNVASMLKDSVNARNGRESGEIGVCKVSFENQVTDSRAYFESPLASSSLSGLEENFVRVVE